ncbi:hypothetical protein [Lachnotalea sp. AF33-28]|uniref:hypothetical protein n=1 Tax=Lachnotalea sp. AF33-28 TaxID=2292046 RepID=UPI0011C3B342|nr:hypothetical protein [Lachnotalea sp. AF33-28]
MSEFRWKSFICVILAGILMLDGCAGKDSAGITTGRLPTSAEESVTQTTSVAANIFIETAVASMDQVSEDGLRYEYRSKNLVMSVYCDEWDKLDKSKSGYQNATEFLQEAAEYFNEIARLTGKSEEYSEYKNINISFLFVDSTVSTTNRLPSSDGMYMADICLSIEYFEHGVAPIAHEITHTLFPLGISKSLGEGLPSYMQDIVSGKPAQPNYGIDADKLCALWLFSEEDKETVTEIFESTGDINNAIFKNIDKRTRAYNFASSFTHYMINNYGMENYLNIYSSMDPYSVYQEVTGQTLEELHEDWRNHLEQYKGKITADEIDEIVSNLFE